MTDEDAAAIVKAAGRALADTALWLVERDPHQWSKRPCGTCESVSRLLGRDFGCVVKRNTEVRR